MPCVCGSGAAAPRASEKRCATGRRAISAVSSARAVLRNSSVSHSISPHQRAICTSSWRASSAPCWARSCVSRAPTAGSVMGDGTCPSRRCWAAVTSTRIGARRPSAMDRSGAMSSSLTMRTARPSATARSIWCATRMSSFSPWCVTAFSSSSSRRLRSSSRIA